MKLVLVTILAVLWDVLGVLADQASKAGEIKASGIQSVPWKNTNHWAFSKPSRPKLPPITTKDWVRNPIDHFILARLEKQGLTPARDADRVTLIRRLSLDLLGLPPKLEEVEAYLKDQSPDAYEQVVERFLASVHYGERWGRHWLDVARYADSNGYSIDAPRHIWKYRDWVIQASNRDLPFDQFTIEQLAGDLLPNPTQDQKIATGFHRNTQINEEGGIDKEQFRIESVMDRVNTTGTAFLGLTIACAQCHNHKFDPITQREYYELFAFFNNADEPVLEVVGELASNEEIKEQIEEIEADLDRYIDTLSGQQRAWEESVTPTAQGEWAADVAKAFQISPKERSRKEKRALFKAFKPEDPEFAKREAKLTGLEKKEKQWVTTLVIAERGQPRDSYLFIKGDFTRNGGPVKPGVLGVLHPLPQIERPTRLDLARWLVDPANPLTARVTLNRIWQEYFGRGIVETENDFGTQGTSPTHPELLDWLASEFHARNWSLKAIHRLIVTSSTYRQDSSVRPELERVDANNRLLARQTRLRLGAEIVRDVALAASGLLNPKIGGPSVFPPQPDGVMNLGQSRRPWKTSTGADRYRRGLYTFFWRATPHPGLTVFDAPDAFSACTRRIRSNTPLQALTLLNDAQFYEMAQGLAARVLTERPKAGQERLDYAFRLCLARRPNRQEAKRLNDYLAQELARSEQEPSGEVAGAVQPPQGATGQEFAAWTAVSRVLLNLDETITRE